MSVLVLNAHETVFFCGPSDIIILLFQFVLLSVVLNFVFVLYRENFANRLNCEYYLCAIFNIL